MKYKSIFRQNKVTDAAEVFPEDFTSDEIELIQKVKGFTMTSVERQVALLRSLDYLIKNNIEGDFVECGVWRGGSAMLAALKFMKSREEKRNIWMYDTFAGMTPPREVDKDFSGKKAEEIMTAHASRKDESVIWAICDLNAVQKNLSSTGFEMTRARFVKGPVEETIPGEVPGRIALLRLDTDWFESTYHELVHLYPLLAPGGVLIIDDYGHWKGAQKAVDSFFAELGTPVFLNRIDMTGRLIVKPGL